MCEYAAGVLYRDFASEQEFRQVAQYARDLGALLYEASAGSNWLVVVRSEANTQVRPTPRTPWVGSQRLTYASRCVTMHRRTGSQLCCETLWLGRHWRGTAVAAEHTSTVESVQFIDSTCKVYNPPSRNSCTDANVQP